MKTITLAFLVGVFGFLGLSSSAHALDAQARKLTFVYGTGWAADDGWIVPMTEQAADALIAEQNAKVSKATCEMKGVFRPTTLQPTVLEFLAYEITDCK